MRVAIFTDTFAPEINGVARTLKRFSDFMSDHNVEHKVYAPVSGNYTAIEQAPVERFASMPFVLYPECRLAFPNPLQTSQSLENFRPDIIHVATPFNIGLAGMYYAKKYNIPAVASYHTNFDNYLQHYNLQFLQKWIWDYMAWFHKPCHKVYVPSPSTRDTLLAKKVHSNIEIWGRGIDGKLYSHTRKTADKIQAIKEKYKITEKKIVLFVGRLAPEKNIGKAITAFNNLPDEIKSDAHFLVIGEGPLYREYSNKKMQKITIAGFVEGESLADIYACADVFLFPSSTETFGNVVLEAMASGLAVIGANAGGVANIIDDGVNGYLCEPDNDQQLNDRLQMLLTNSQQRQKIGLAAIEYASNKSWDEIFNKLLSSYANVLSSVVARSA